MKKIKNLILRIIASPFVLGIVLVKFIYHSLEKFVQFIIYGGEFIPYAKGENETIKMIYDKVARQQGYSQKMGSELIFISRIKRDGSGTELIKPDEDMRHLNNTKFEITCLSISNKTFIASEFNSYVVKLKS